MIGRDMGATLKKLSKVHQFGNLQGLVLAIGIHFTCNFSFKVILSTYV